MGTSGANRRRHPVCFEFVCFEEKESSLKKKAEALRSMWEVLTIQGNFQGRYVAISKFGEPQQPLRDCGEPAKSPINFGNLQIALHTHLHCSKNLILVNSGNLSFLCKFGESEHLAEPNLHILGGPDIHSQPARPASQPASQVSQSAESYCYYDLMTVPYRMTHRSGANRYLSITYVAYAENPLPFSSRCWYDVWWELLSDLILT